MLGLIFLKFADNKYRQNEAAILAEYQKLKGGRREEKLFAIAIRQCGFYGQEKTLETVKLAKMNLAVNGLHGSLIQANTYVEDPHGSLGQFDYPLVYLYHWLKLGKPHFESLSGGSTFAELTKGTFKRMEILAPLFRSMETHLKANTSLKATRDALLPRLISGKLAVDALDIRFPPGMAPRAP